MRSPRFRRWHALRDEEALYQARRLLWRSCENAPGSAAAAPLEFARVADSAIRGVESSAAPVLLAIERVAEGQPMEEAVQSALDLHAAGGLLLKKLHPLTSRLGEKLMKAGRDILDAVPPTVTRDEVGSIHGYLYREVVVQKPTCLVEALAHAGFTPQQASIGREIVKRIGRIHGKPSSGDEPRVIALAYERVPSCVFGRPPEKKSVLRALHLRGDDDIWSDIVDRRLALPIGSRIFVEDPDNERLNAHLLSRALTPTPAT